MRRNLKFVQSAKERWTIMRKHGEAVENTVMGLINAGTMPEKYHSSEGWFFNYAPVEHFMIISLVFILLYYFGCLLKYKRDLLQKILIWVYSLAYIFTLIEFWQMVGITLVPMILITGLAVHCRMSCLRN